MKGIRLGAPSRRGGGKRIRIPGSLQDRGAAWKKFANDRGDQRILLSLGTLVCGVETTIIATIDYHGGRVTSTSPILL